MLKTLNEDITTIVSGAEGERLQDVKLFIRPKEEASEAGVARQLAEAFAARREGALPAQSSSPERVKSVRVADYIPELA